MEFDYKNGTNLAKISYPHKIYLNSRENVLVVQSMKWVGVIILDEELSLFDDEFSPCLQLIGYDNVQRIEESTDVVVESKFHPLSPYAL